MKKETNDIAAVEPVREVKQFKIPEVEPGYEDQENFHDAEDTLEPRFRRTYKDPPQKELLRSDDDGSDTSEEDDPFDKSFRASKFTHFVGFKSLSINNQLPDNLYEAYSGKFGYWDDAINKEIKDMTELGAIKLCAPVKGFKAIPTRFR